MSWIAFSPNLPAGVTQLGTSVATGLNAVKTALQALKTQVLAAEALVAGSESAGAATLNQTIQQVVTLVNTQLDALVTGDGVYVLFVPLPKPGLVRIATDPGSTGAPGSNAVRFPTNHVLAGLPPDAAAALQTSLVYQQIVNPPELFVGGNAYFVKTVAEAVFDAADPNRPTFQTTDAWVYACVMAGSSTVDGVLGLGGFVDRLLGGTTRHDSQHVPTTRGLASVVPQGVQVGPTPLATGLVVQWNVLAQASVLGAYDGSVVTPTEWAVIRSTDLRALTATKVGDLFATGQLVEGSVGLYGATVLHVEAYDGVACRYLDQSVLQGLTTPAQVAGTTYYYHVAFRTRLTSADGNVVTDLGYERLSACRPFPLARLKANNANLGPSHYPDWVRSPSLLQLIPPLAALVDQVTTMLGSLAQGAQGLAARNQQYVAFLDRQVQAYADRATELQQYVTLLQNLFGGSTTTGLYATTRSGTGNAGSFVADLTQAFSDTSDTGRPAFDAGDEYTLGAVVLAVGPDVNGIAALLEALFGPPAASDPVVAGVASIATQVATVNQAALDAALGPDLNAATPSNTFNADLTPNPGGPDAACIP